MVTKYDVFIELYDMGGPRKIIDIVKSLKQKKSAYDIIRKILENLIEMKLIAKNDYGYEIIMNHKNQHLFDMLKYCIKNDINYNRLFDENVASILEKLF